MTELQEEQKTQQFPKQQVSSNPISDLFEDPLYTDLFHARCHDTGETANSKTLLIISSRERKTLQGRIAEKEREELIQS